MRATHSEFDRRAGDVATTTFLATHRAIPSPSSCALRDGVIAGRGKRGPTCGAAPERFLPPSDSKLEFRSFFAYEDRVRGSYSRLTPDARRISAALAWRVQEKRLSLLPPTSPLARDPARDAARLLDHCLTEITHDEARLRLALGHLLAVFGRNGALTKLGFIRLADFARERLGISGSEADLARRVTARLEELPLLRQAFLGGRISWTKIRILVSTAKAETEARWLELAETRTVRELEKLVAEDSALGARDVGAVREDDDLEIEGEPRVRFRMRAPAWAWLFFRRVIDLARSVASEPGLPVWKAVEAITAEGLATTGATAFEPDIDTELAWLASRRRGSRLGERWSPFLGSMPGGDLDFEAVCPAVAKWLGIAEDALREMLPGAEADPAAGAADLTAIELDQRLRRVTDRLRTLDARIGCALALFSERRLHRELGFFDFEGYVTERLGIGLRKARSLIALERAAAESPALRRAYDGGSLSWVRALTILPLVRDERCAEQWVERASTVIVRRLVDEVNWALERHVTDEPGRAPSPPPLRANLEPVQMRVNETDAKLDRTIEFWGPVSVVTNLERLAIAWSEPKEAFWKGLVRLLAAVARQWQGEGRRYKERIVERDGYRCIVPCCTSRRNLHVHHIIFRSQGGGDEDWNRGTLCAGHHHQCLHRYHVVAHGRAPDAIEWTFGATEWNGPLMRLAGDVYLPADSSARPRESANETAEERPRLGG